jgi:hypothetical protein
MMASDEDRKAGPGSQKMAIEVTKSNGSQRADFVLAAVFRRSSTPSVSVELHREARSERVLAPFAGSMRRSGFILMREHEGAARALQCSHHGSIHDRRQGR